CASGNSFSRRGRWGPPRRASSFGTSCPTSLARWSCRPPSASRARCWPRPPSPSWGWACLPERLPGARWWTRGRSICSWHPTWPWLPAWPSPSPSSASTCWGTVFAIVSIRAPLLQEHVDLGADEDHQRGDEQPQQKNDERAQRPIGDVVAPEVHHVGGKSPGSDQPEDDGDDRAEAGHSEGSPTVGQEVVEHLPGEDRQAAGEGDPHQGDEGAEGPAHGAGDGRRGHRHHRRDEKKAHRHQGGQKRDPLRLPEGPGLLHL